MTMRFLAIGALVVVAAHSLHAQGVSPKPLGANTLSGVVTDTLGTLLGDVEVYITELKRRVRTRDDGSFVMDRMKPGVYSVGARALGYVAKSHTVTVGDNGGSVYIRMIRISAALPAMVSVAERTGLMGIIGDTAYQPMPNVTIRVVGNEGQTQTDSAGAFHLPLAPGRYMVELKREGYKRQLVGVTIPAQEGRRLAAWMVPQFDRPNPLEGANVFEMSQRLMRASPLWSKYYTREDMEKQGLTELRQVANMAATRIVGPDCPVVIDGGPRTLPLWQLGARDIEFVELYTARPARSSVTSLGGNPTKYTTSTSMTPTSECGVALMAWLRH